MGRRRQRLVECFFVAGGLEELLDNGEALQESLTLPALSVCPAQRLFVVWRSYQNCLIPIVDCLVRGCLLPTNKIFEVSQEIILNMGKLRIYD